MIMEKVSQICLGYGTGVFTAGSLAEADLKLSIVLRITGIISFGIYILINLDKIEENWKKLINRFKRNESKTKSK